MSDTSTYSSNWQVTTLRVKDPKKSIEFYERNFSCKLMDCVHGKGESRYFLARLKQSDEGEACKVEPGTDAAHERLFKLPANYVELLHIHGTESDPELHYDSGNNEPKRGFGHIAFNTKDVCASCEKLEQNGCSFQKKPDEGRMKGLAFVKDPDGYWIEIVRRAEDSSFPEEFNLSQTMIRVKDPVKSVAFYAGLMQMKLLSVRHFSDFSLYFLMSVPPGAPAFPTDESQRNSYMKNAWLPVLELTHNHGTEKNENFRHHDGNSDPKGFCSIGFSVDNLAAARKALEHSGVQFADAELAAAVGAEPDKVEVVRDPDGYAVKLMAVGAQL